MDAITDPDGRIHVVGTQIGNGQILEVHQTGSGWSELAPWNEFGGQALSYPFLVAESGAAFGLLAIDSDLHVRYAVDGGTWRDLGGSIAGRPTGLRDAQGNLHVFARGADGMLWATTDDAAGPATWERLGDTLIVGAPTAVLDAEDRIHVFMRAGDGRVLHTYQQAGGAWADWQELSPTGGWSDHWDTYARGSMLDPAVILDHEGRLNVFFARPGDIWYRRRQSATSPTEWAPAQLVGSANPCDVPPITTDRPDDLDKFFKWPPPDPCRSPVVPPPGPPSPIVGPPVDVVAQPVITPTTPEQRPEAAPADRAAPSRVSLAFSVRPKPGKTATRLRSLRVRGVPAGATVHASCVKGCARRTLTIRAAKGGDVSLDRIVGRRSLRVGTKIRVKVTAAGWQTTRTLTVRASRQPKVESR